MSDVNASALDHAAQMAARKAIRDDQKAQPGALVGYLTLVAWLLAVAAILAGFVLFSSPGSYGASMVPAISYTISGLIAALLLGAVGRIVVLLEVIARKS
jgi:hypothetical protein